MRVVSTLAASATLALLTVHVLSACSPSAGQGDTSRSGTGATSSVGGDTGIFGAGGFVSGGGDVGIGDTGSGTGAAIGVGPDSGCANDVHQGERLPLDMYFVVDTSGSMSERVTGGTKWSVVSGSLVSFLKDPANADIGTGITYFPSVNPAAPQTCLTDPDCTTSAGNFGTCVQGLVIPILGCIGCYCSAADGCDAATYATPSVPISLPPNHPAVVTDIGQHNPGGGTPTRPALEGGMKYANSWAAAHPGRTTIVVLATDGDPTGCTTNAVQDSADIAAAGLSGANHIKTFVIGIGNSLASLNQIAAAGGTNQAYVLDTGGDVAKAFSDALASIHGQAASCDFKVPTDSTVDPTKVNVTLTEHGATKPTPILQTIDGSAKTCGTELGWYYDAPGAPTLIKMCPAPCQKLSQGGSIQLILGCERTQTLPR